MQAEPKFDAAGTFVGSSYVFATAREFAKFGQLYLHDGIHDGKRVLPEGWVDHARVQHVFDDETGLGYGAHWWTLPGERNSLVASGYEGQYIMVIPDRDLVVVRLGKTSAEQRNSVVATLREVIEQFPIIGGQ
jgi:CubicO group peptidase (beta-lactamase class C family)